MREQTVVTREAIRAERHDPVFVSDAFEGGGVWVHEVDPAALAEIEAATRVTADGTVTVDARRYRLHRLAAALRVGPKPGAARLYGGSDGDLAALELEVRPGARDYLLDVADALLGYENAQSAAVRRWRGQAAPADVAVVTRQILASESHEPVFVSDAFEGGGVWVHELPVELLDKIRGVTRTFGADEDSIVTDVRMFQLHQLSAALRVGPDPDAARLYEPTDEDLAALEAEIPPGRRLYLVQVSDALLGFRNDQLAKVRFLRRNGRSSASGCSTDGGGSPASAEPDLAAATGSTDSNGS